ncbi:hypothetical protein BD779DRAFT_405374 [Infundibulicybe gibba]|nr:hypothetical protein BD779DRAFT_405374 [Infundibulicybe gibba]
MGFREGRAETCATGTQLSACVRAGMACSSQLHVRRLRWWREPRADTVGEGPVCRYRRRRMVAGHIGGHGGRCPRGSTSNGWTWGRALVFRPETGATAAWKPNWPPPDFVRFLCYPSLLQVYPVPPIALARSLTPFSPRISGSLLASPTSHLLLPISFTWSRSQARQVPLALIAIYFVSSFQVSGSCNNTTYRILILKLSARLSILFIYSPIYVYPKPMRLNTDIFHLFPTNLSNKKKNELQ